MPGVVICVPGLPVPWARAGARGARHFTPAKQRVAMADLRIVAERAMNGRPPFDEPVAVTFTWTYPWPASLSKRRRGLAASAWKSTKPDGSNLQKLVEDALNGIVWRDDALIAHWAGWKRFGDTAGLTVICTPAAEVEL